MIKQANDLNITFSRLLIMSLHSTIVLILSVEYLLSIAVCIRLMLRCSLTRNSFVNGLSVLTRHGGREHVSPVYSVVYALELQSTVVLNSSIFSVDYL